MKVTVTSYLNVRVGKPALSAACYQYIAPGSELEVEDQLYKGDVYDSIDTWLKDAAGNYYWVGGVDHPIANQKRNEITNPKVDGKTTFDWFNAMGIATIWDKFNEKGDKAKVVILDTGYDLSNADLSKGVKNSNIIITNLNYPGINLVINDQSNDVHGSRCAALVGARNSLDWIIGIAPACELQIGKISIDKEILDFNYILEGIKWGISQGADVISISYAYEDLVDADIPGINLQLKQIAENNNVLIFAAAGNCGSPQKTGNRYPASFDSCISVGAIDANRRISSKMVLCERTILHAPGENIESYSDTAVPSTESGTSFSTPIAAAIAALAISFLKKKNPGHSFDKSDLVNKMISSGDLIAGSNTKRIINPLKLFNNL